MHDLDRLKVIRDVLEGRLPQIRAAEQLDLCDRQVRRLCRKVQQKGPKGLIHALRGRRSNHQLEAGLLDRAMKLVVEHYHDFNPSFACEKLLERHGIRLAPNTLRAGLIREGLWRPRRYGKRHRAWRQRKACLGELVQVDGSDHPWFEERGPRCWLIAFVDDATSRLLYAEFAEAEDTLTLLRLSRAYLRRHGRPRAFYVDQDSIYKTTRQPSVDEEARDEQPMTQFTRAMSELDVTVICARSPQAKGRVERGFKTHQNRLVRELRLAGISTLEAGNDFLRKVYLPVHNKKFGVPPAASADAHRALGQGLLLDRILSLRKPRTVFNDHTVRWKGRFIQLLSDQPVRVAPGDQVEIEIRLDTSMHVRFEGRYLNYKTIPKPSRKQSTPIIDLRSFFETKPLPKPVAADHPWQRMGYFAGKQNKLALELTRS